MQRDKLIKILRWIARIWSILVLSLTVLIFVGSVFSPEGDDATWKPIELVAALFFPIGMTIGMIVAWRKELIGGLITVISFIIFSILILIPRGAVVRAMPMFLFLTAPGILFLINGIICRKK
jgi:hypothetical protein